MRRPSPPASPDTTSARRHLPRQGTLALVLIAGAGGLGGCGDPPPEPSIEASRGEYGALADCVQDWGSEADCEPEFDPAGLDKAGGPAQPDGQAASGNGFHGTRHSVVWLGPFFTRSGTVYRYDGRVQALPTLPGGAQGLRTRTTTEPALYTTTPGRYLSTPPAPDASPAKIGLSRGRGGFGGTGRSISGGG